MDGGAIFTRNSAARVRGSLAGHGWPGARPQVCSRLLRAHAPGLCAQAGKNQQSCVSLVFCKQDILIWWYELGDSTWVGLERARSHARSLAQDLMVKWVVLVKDDLEGGEVGR